MSELEELLDSLDMESYLDYAGMDYRTRPGSSGRQLNVKCCPTCGNSGWKVYINEGSGLGNCFAGGCSLGTFNKWKFIKAALGDPSNAQVVAHIKTAAMAMGWRPKRQSAAVDYDGEVQLPNSIPLPDGEGNNLDYLLRRGVTNELAEYFQLRYCHAGGYQIEYEGREIRQDYSGRVIIPVFDLDGKLRTFQGRDITGQREPKYQFPPGLPASGRFLYNGHNAHRAEELVVGEGAFDVIAIHAALQEDPALRQVAAVGTFGMHLSAEGQLDAFRALMGGRLKRVTLMWDSEKKALRGAIGASEKLRSIGLKTRIAVLPKDKDPNEVHPSVVRDAFRDAVDPEQPGGMRQLLSAMLFR